MSREKLTYLAKKTLEELNQDILNNLDRYREGDFSDLVSLGGWSIKLSVDIDMDPLLDLDPSKTREAEIDNSLLVWKALHNMTPALACEDRIWTRLSHVECLDYSRKRWIKDGDDESVLKDVATHFFAPTQLGFRDDHAIAKLWWNAKIAKDIWPNDQRGALKLILKTADIRSNLVERAWTGGRPCLAGSILRLMERQSWVTSSELSYRELMKVVNHRGGGIIFELLSDSQLDSFMDECVSLARAD